MMQPPSMLASALVIVFCASVAAAQGESAAGRQFLKTLDTDGNGFVGRSEWKGSGTTFVSLDVDLDGWLSTGELGRSAKAPPLKPASEAVAPDRLLVAIGTLVTKNEVFERRCLACHDETRVERSAKSAAGWADTVRRMREKKDAAISDKEARVIVDYLVALRAPVARSQASFGTANPALEWGLIVGGGDLHRFDRDRDGRFDAGELTRLAHARADLDGNDLLSAGELSLLPLAVDRRALFIKLDRDKNGGVSVKELGIPTPLIELFDRSGDGSLDRTELPRSRAFGGPYPMILAADAKTAMQLLDRDRDRSLSTIELARFAATRIRFDENGDGDLDLRELETAVTAARVEGPLAAFDDCFTRYDLDGNGSIARAEYPGRSSMFRRLDLDGDGTISSRDAPSGLVRTEFTPEAQRWRE